MRASTAPTASAPSLRIDAFASVTSSSSSSSCKKDAADGPSSTDNRTPPSSCLHVCSLARVSACFDAAKKERVLEGHGRAHARCAPPEHEHGAEGSKREEGEQR
jgi:hypothetical protein